MTKNRFDPADRVGYQRASNYGNYNGAVMLHLAEAYLSRQHDIAERPAPAEIGGYAFATGGKFASAVANAGGMQLFAALRGDTNLVYDHYWTALGIERFGRVDWDTRLGPSDGVRDAKSGQGVTFAPTWRENGRWVRMADVPDRYRAAFSVQFTHPLLVRCALEYRPIKPDDGPSFRHELVVTPDGVLATLHAPNGTAAGVTWPLLEDDGVPLRTRVGDRLATTAFAANADEQCFLALDARASVHAEDARIQSTYGWLRPIRVTVPSNVNHTFVYPRSAGDPDAEGLAKSFRLEGDGYRSCARLGKRDAVCRSVCRRRRGRKHRLQGRQDSRCDVRSALPIHPAASQRPDHRRRVRPADDPDAGREAGSAEALRGGGCRPVNRLSHRALYGRDRRGAKGVPALAVHLLRGTCRHATMSFARNALPVHRELVTPYKPAKVDSAVAAPLRACQPAASAPRTIEARISNRLWTNRSMSAGACDAVGMIRSIDSPIRTAG